MENRSRMKENMNRLDILLKKKMRYGKKNGKVMFRYKCNEKGNITVFLTLLMIALLTIFLAAIEIIRYEQAKGRCEHLALGAMEHIMADYEVELANRYHLYVIDKTYLGQGEEVGSHRVWNYLEQNINSVGIFGNKKGFYHFDVVDAQLEPLSYLYSDGCQPLKDQIHNWFIHSMIPMENRISRREQKVSMKDKNNKKMKENNVQKMNWITQKEKIVSKKDKDRRIYFRISDKDQRSILYMSKSSTGKPSASKTSTGKPSTSKPVQENDQSAVQDLLKNLDPRQEMETIRKNGILSVASNSYLPLSSKIIGDTQLPSYTIAWDSKANSLFEKAKNRIELETYIFQHFNSALSVVGEKETAYQNEIEYLITGKRNDYDCLEMVAKEITAIRSALNFVAIQKDNRKVTSVKNAATLICALLEQPEAVDAVTQGILMAWAFGESVADVKCLLQGDKVPMIKGAEDWHLAFHQLFYIRYVKVKGSEEGETYEDYLKKLLLMISEKKLYMRMLDLLELNVALQEPEFYIQNSMTKWKIDIQINADVRLFRLPMANRNSYHFSASKIGEYQF